MAKRGTLEHPKTKRLARQIDMPAWAALGLLEAFWHWIGRYCPTGAFTSEDWFDCADTIRLDPGVLQALIASGYVDQFGDAFLVHDWQDHADDTVKKTLQKRDEVFADGSAVRKSSSKPPETNDSRTVPDSKPESFANDSRMDREQIASDSRHARALSHEPRALSLEPEPGAMSLPTGGPGGLGAPPGVEIPLKPPESPPDPPSEPPRDAFEPPWWEFGDAGSLEVRIASAIRSGKGYAKFDPPEERVSKLASYVQGFAPDDEAGLSVLEAFTEYLDSKRNPPYSDPIRALRDWFAKRESEWRRIRRQREIDSNSRNGFAPKSLEQRAAELGVSLGA